MEAAEFRAELALSSRYDAIEISCIVLDEFLQQSLVDIAAAGRIELALREALANAIRHGNGPNSTDSVLLELEIAANTLVIRVGDRGLGFDHHMIPESDIQENILRSHGRGIFAMRECMDSVSFSDREGGGTLVTMYRILT